jgi:TRAP-type C4-dicarboxylate transport system permease small subunit
MRKLRALEDVLIRVESVLAVVLVLTMLLLAAYNVVYRNVLVPLQNHWAHSGPPLEPTPLEPTPLEPTVAKGQDAPQGETKSEPETKTLDTAQAGADDFGGFGGLGDEGEGKADAAKPDAAKPADDFGGFGGLGDEGEGKADAAKPDAAKPADDFGGFGGGLGDEAEPEAEPKPPTPKPPVTVAVAEPAKPASDDFGGFGGGLGDDEDDDPEPETKADAAKPASDGFGGFGGGLGDEGGEAKPETKAGEAKADAQPEEAKVEGDLVDESEDDLGEDDLGDDDQFANLPDIDAVAKESVDAIPKGGPPPEGSFAAWAVAFIDDIKLDWIDIFLRQLVIIVAFFGAMLATQRGKHINVDALSKLLPSGVRRVVAVVLPLSAVAVCIVLAKAGWDLVEISREYPKDLLPSVPEWTLQLMFPVGFGLLATHFVIRVIEAALVPPEPDAPPGAARSAAADPLEPTSDDDTAAAGKGGQG